MSETKKTRTPPPTCVRLSDETKRRVQEAAKIFGLRPSEVMREAMDIGLEKMLYGE